MQPDAGIEPDRRGAFRRRPGLERGVDLPVQGIGQAALASVADHPHRHASGGASAMVVNFHRQSGEELGKHGVTLRL